VKIEILRKDPAGEIDANSVAKTEANERGQFSCPLEKGMYVAIFEYPGFNTAVFSFEVDSKAWDGLTLTMQVGDRNRTAPRFVELSSVLHEFAFMPDHIHVPLTPLTSFEKAVQFIKGSFSYRTKKQLGSNMEVWQKGFSDHRIRDASDYAVGVSYIHNNPVHERFCERREEFPYSSAHLGFELDAAPQGLKPANLDQPDAARLEAAPFQSKT
jgi:hypothetical protein